MPGKDESCRGLPMEPLWTHGGRFLRRAGKEREQRSGPTVRRPRVAEPQDLFQCGGATELESRETIDYLDALVRCERKHLAFDHAARSSPRPFVFSIYFLRFRQRAPISVLITVTM